VDQYPTIFTIDNVNNLPQGLTFNPVGNKVYIAGRIPFMPSIAKSYTFTITASREGNNEPAVKSSRTFTLRIIGDIDNRITWVSPTQLGTISANFISELQVVASSSVDTALIYSITAGTLPPGLSLSSDGGVTGKVNQYGVPNISRLTTIDGGLFTMDNLYTTIDGSRQYDIIGLRGLILFDADNPGFTIDGGTTTFDRTYTFTVKAQDQYGFASAFKQFIISIVTPNNKLFSNIKAQPLLSLSQRASFKEFITNSDVFTSTSVYRPSDPNFGIRKDLAMLIYAGIESVEAAAFLGAMGLNNKRKRFQFGSIKKAVANKDGGPIYEIVYVEMVDPAELNGVVPGKSITNNARDQLTLTADISNAIWASPTDLETMNLAEAWLERPISDITIDSTAFNVSDSAPKKHYINSITNWRNNIAEVGDSERNFLPVWMRSIQPGSKQQLGFKLAVPLCYCKPGTADDIILNIKFSGFDFKTLDYTIDRYIIDSVEGYSSDKYLVFKNHSTTV
jgi:hypothetical protein